MKENRPWLITIHCANHRVASTLKDAVKEIAKFAECDKFYTNIFCLFTNSGKLKTETKNAAAALNISYYTLHKIHDARFLNHRRRGFKDLLHNWPVFITGFESSSDTRTKIKGILIKLKSYSFLCKVAVYLERVNPLSSFLKRIF